MEASAPALAVRREQRQKEQYRLIVIINISYLIAISIMGFILVCVTAWMIGSNFWLCPILNLVYVTPWLAMAIGFGNFVLAIIGAVLLIKGHTRGTFQPFMIGTGFLVIGLVVVLILSIKVGIDIEEPKFRTSLYDLFVEAKTEYRASDLGRSALNCWQGIQSRHHCCGGNTPTDWAIASNASANESATEAFEAPTSCNCPVSWLRRPNGANRSCVVMHARPVFRFGCIEHRIVPLAREHLTVLKVIAPCMAVFNAAHVALALFLAIRSQRLSAVDVYASGQGRAGDEDCGERNTHRRLRRNRMAADVSGVAPFALELETTQGCA